MANLQMYSTRVGTPFLQQPLHQPFLSASNFRVSPSTRVVSLTRREQSSFSVAAAAAAAESSNESCIRGNRASDSGSRHSTTTERRISRAARLLETESSVPSESTVHTARSTFEAQVKAAGLECTSRGCRPVFDESSKEGCCSTSGDIVGDKGWGDDGAFRLLEARVASYIERRTMRDLEIRHLCPDLSFPLDFAEFVNDVWQERSTATKYFDIAMKRNPNDANSLLRYAQFAWKTLGDLDKADELFARAVNEADSDADMHAMYALFLWQIAG